MGNKKMDNISTVKVNAYEIAKAPDIDFGYKSILDHFSILVDRLFNYHSPEITDKLFFNSDGIGKDRKDFVIGGGLVAAGDAMLRPLPMVAFSNAGGVFITNGLDVDNRPHQIPLGEDFTVEGYRIESIYIGNAEKDESIYGSTPGENAKRDPNWDTYESEWRATYQVGKSGIDTPFREFKKRQMQAVRFYVNPGVVELEKKNAIAAATPTNNDVFSRRVKIAEVLVHCVLDSGNVPHIQPIQPDDVRFVTAVQYWEDNEEQDPQQIDSKWTQYVSKVQPNIHSGMTHKQQQAEQERADAETANRYAFRAEHYNYRWTADLTRTYRLGSVSEISERLYKIHKTDGTLKEEVVRRKHIFLRAEYEESLTGADIPIDHSARPPIELPYNRKIKADERINRGLLQLAENLRGDWIPISGESISIYIPYITNLSGSDSIRTGFERIAQVITRNRERIDTEEQVRANADATEAQIRAAHEANTQPHGATSSAAAERLAWRDSAGRMEVQDPVSDLQVVNIHYLNSTFKMEVVMKVLMSKLITTQSEFDQWIAQRGNEAYTYVYLKGSFTASNPIGLGEIGTKEVTAVGSASISIKIKRDNKYSNTGIYGRGNKEETINGVTMNITGAFDGGIVGFRSLNCYKCKVFITGDSGSDGYLGSNPIVYPPDDGIGVICFVGCIIELCSADAKGGNGGNGAGYHNLSCTNGGHGGYAQCFWDCSGTCESASAIGGNGGNGGNGTYATDWRDGVAGGNGGNGGHAIASSGNVSFYATGELRGGNGGSGGRGEIGAGAEDGSCIWYNKSRGGNGGNGGDGGNVQNIAKFNLYVGLGGVPGAGGAGCGSAGVNGEYGSNGKIV